MVSAERSSVHSPRATRMRATSTVPGSGQPCRGGHAIHAMPMTAVTMQAMRHGRRPARQARATSTTQAAHAHHGGSTTATAAPGIDAAERAIHPNDAAPAAADQPKATPHAGSRPANTVHPTPATVVAAATGMVSTLSGTARRGIAPPCAAAIGTLAVHATVAETTAAASASASSPGTSPGLRRLAAAIAPRSLRHHRSVASDESRRSASTTP